MKNFTKCLAVLFLTSMVAACGGSDSAPTLVSIAITPANPVVTTGATQQFTATGTYSDSTSTVLTTSVTWSTSNATVSTISNSAGTEGLATAGASGSTTISALYNGVTGTTSLTVPAPASLDITADTSSTFNQTLTGFDSTLSFTVTNTGGLPSGSISVSLSGTDSAHFFLGPTNTCTGSALAGGASCTVEVTFRPLAAPRWMYIQLNVSATPGGTVSLSLSGEAQT